jgi:hypothetical protein
MRLSDSRVKAIVNNRGFRLILEAYSRGYDMRLLNEAVNSISLSVSEIEMESPSYGSHVRSEDREKEQRILTPPVPPPQ